MLKQIQIEKTYHMIMAEKINVYRHEQIESACRKRGIAIRDLSLKTDAPLEIPLNGSDEIHTWTLTHNTDYWLYRGELVIGFAPAVLQGEFFTQEVIVL